MNKKGQTEIVLGTIGLIIVISGLVIGSITAVENNRYFGDSITNLIYDKTKCDINQYTKPENQIRFDSLNEAHKRGYNDSPICV